jgi:hypothetical protein
VQPINTGVYTAVVADAFGCSTNASAMLAIVPQFTLVSMEGGNLLLSGCGGTSNGTYTVLTATNLSTDPIVGACEI